MRTVKTTSGATAVQVVWSSRRGSRAIGYLRSAHDEAELEALKAAVQQRIAAPSWAKLVRKSAARTIVSMAWRRSSGGGSAMMGGPAWISIVR